MDNKVSRRHLFTQCSLTGHEHDEDGTHNEVTGMPIHRHLSQRDSQKVVIKEVEDAIEDGEGCQVIRLSIVNVVELLLHRYPVSNICSSISFFIVNGVEL